jgi:hypothetical protein
MGLLHHQSSETTANPDRKGGRVITQSSSTRTSGVISVAFASGC